MTCNQPNSNDGSSTDNSNESGTVADTDIDIDLDDEHALINAFNDLNQLVHEQADRIDQLEQQQDEYNEMIDTLRGFLQTDNPQERLVEYIKNLEEKADAQDEMIEKQDEQLDRKDAVIEEQNEIVENLIELLERKDTIIDDYEQFKDELIEHISDEIDEDDLSETDKERLEELENELQQYKVRNEKDKAQIRSAVHDADQQSENNIKVIDKINDKVKDFTSELSRVNGNRRSSLEQVVRLPDEIARDSLSKNQYRARHIASEITELDWKHAMKGKVVDSATIKQTLRETYRKAHDQTVARVMEFLNVMGDEHVELKQTNGSNKLVFDQCLIDQLASAEQLDGDDVDKVNTNGVITTVRGG